jgi:hypothetical protein
VAWSSRDPSKDSNTVPASLDAAGFTIGIANATNGKTNRF